MSTATAVSPSKIDRVRDGETRIVLRNIDWATYDSLCARLAEQHVRMTYDRGTLELMSPSSRHERYEGFSGRFIDELTTELEDAPTVRPYGHTTWRRVALERGLEADQCYYFDPAKLAAISGRDPDRPDDPFPDLAIEIEVSSSAVDKMSIYAALGVREVWRSDGEVATFEQLGPDGAYHPADRSLFLPVGPEDWLHWLWESDGADTRDWRLRLRAWINDDLRNRA